MYFVLSTSIGYNHNREPLYFSTLTDGVTHLYNDYKSLSHRMTGVSGVTCVCAGSLQPSHVGAAIKEP